MLILYHNNQKFYNFLLILLQFDSMHAQNIPILLYYRFRGQLQPVRNFFCYLNVCFLEIHLEHWQEQKKKLTKQMLNILSKFKIDKAQVPSLIYGGMLINGAMPIMSFMCKVLNRLQLFGTNIQMRSRILEIMEIYQVKQPQSMLQLFKCAQFACDNNRTKKKSYQQLMDNSKYIRQICQYIDKQQKPKYVLGQFTIIDFYFMETCVYMLGCYGDKDRVYYQCQKQPSLQASDSLHKPNPYYINIMKDYKQSIKNQPFYLQHRDYLESFSIISVFTNQEKIVGLKKIWLGNPKFVQ